MHWREGVRQRRHQEEDDALMRTGRMTIASSIEASCSSSSRLLDDYDGTKQGTNDALMLIASLLPQLATSFHMYFYTTFYAPMYVLAEFLSSLINSGFWCIVTYFALSSAFKIQPPLVSSSNSPLPPADPRVTLRNPTRHPTPVPACCPKSVYHEYQGNFSGIVLLRHYVFQLKLVPGHVD